MAIQGLPENITASELYAQVGRGGRFVVFQYCISVLVMTFKRSSDVFYLAPGQSGVRSGLPYTLLSLVVGWWGIPWGFIYTPMVLFTNLTGGKDVTAEVLAALLRTSEQYPAESPS